MYTLHTQTLHCTYLYLLLWKYNLRMFFIPPHQIMSASHVCRPKNHDCDLPESCTGKSAMCPEDVFTVNGLPCNNGKGYCYNGQCPQRMEQCIKMWGSSKYSNILMQHNNTEK